MSDFRQVLARNITEIGLFAGISIMILSGVVGLEAFGTIGLVVLLAGIFLGDPIASLLEPSADEPATNDPLEKLRELYAEGKIDRNEFERRVEDLLETDVEIRTDDPTAAELDRKLERR